jgi:lipoate-protein ligase A
VPRPRLVLLRESFPERPALDTAVSHALLVLAGRGEGAESLRLHRAGPNVAFGKLDAVRPGYPAAVAAARERGFEAVERLAGGRAAVYHPDVVGIAHTIPHPDPRPGTYERFAREAEIAAGALRSLGVDARVGEVPGEYCPGAFSVSAAGRLKLAGVGQRVVRGAAHVGGVVVVRGADRVRDVLVPVYAALGLEWDPSTTGSVADVVPWVGYEEAERALVESYAEQYELIPGALSPEALALAEELEAHHLALAPERAA